MKHKVEYALPGSFFSEHEIQILEKRGPDEALKLAPDYAFAFVLYDEEDPPDLGPDFNVIPVRKNVSGRYYIGGELFNLEQLTELLDSLDDYEQHGLETLMANMRSNNWPLVIRCRTSNWQPFEDGDTLLEEPSHV